MKKRSRQRFAFHWINDERGAVALIISIVMLAVVTLVISATAFSGLDDLDQGFAAQKSEDILLSAESCAEEALLRLSQDSSFSGTSLQVGEAACTITVTGTPCGTCTITAAATGEGYTRNIQVGVTVSGGSIDITSWEETN